MARFEGAHCTMEITRPAAGVLLVVITGRDIGELGNEPFDALGSELGATGTFELFIDGKKTRGVTIDVSNDWALWLRRWRSRLNRVTMLSGSRFIELTAEFVRRFAGLENVMRITTDPDAFDAALEEAKRDKTTSS